MSKDLKEERELGRYISKGRVFQAQGTAHGKAHAALSWHIQGPQKRLCALSGVSRGRGRKR